MAVNSLEEAYNILGIRPRDLVGLSAEGRYNLYKKRYRARALEYHPDRNRDNPDANDQFQAVNEAYEYLVKPIDRERAEQEFKRYFPESKPIKFPLEAVDLRLEMMVREEFQEVLMRFSRLETDVAKEAFAQRYRDFVPIARYLAEHSADLSESRFRQFGDLFGHYTPKLAQIWRTNMLEIFGEEMLDDFSYREAIGFGQWSSVLALRKLVNPVKWVAAIIMTLLALIKAGYIQLQVLLSTQINLLRNALTQGVDDDNFGDVLLAVVFLITAVTVPILVGYYCFSAYFVVACVPLLDKICRWISCPTNTLVRPLLASLGLQDSLGRYMPFVVPLFLLGGAAGIIFALSAFSIVTLPIAVVTLPVAEVIKLLLSVSIILSQLYMAYFMLKVLYITFKNSIFLGIIQLSLIASCIGLSILFPVQVNLGPVTVMTLGETAFMNISFAILCHAILNVLEQGASYVNSIMEKQPLPTSPIPENFKSVINDSLNYSTYSHELFNTRQDAKPLTSNERSFWRQTQSFFGFCDTNNGKCADETPDPFTASPSQLLLTFD